MAANRKPRKKYRPKVTLLNAVERCLSGVRPPRESDQRHVKIINHGALHDLTHGAGSRQNWDDLARALNIAHVLAEGGIGDDFLPDIKQAWEAMKACGRRWRTWNKWQLLPDEVEAIAYALEVHDKQLEVAGVIQIERAAEEVARRIRSGRIEQCEKPARPQNGIAQVRFDAKHDQVALL